eukprot:m.37403 g.37403  ORF g.37403 m.37403 type:complete len:240 (+) comp17657_c0_seq1:265-984(+)
MSTPPAGTCDCSPEGSDNISFQVAFLIGAVAFVVGVLLTLVSTMLRQYCKDKENSYPLQHHQGDHQQPTTSRRARGLDYNDFSDTPQHATTSVSSPSMMIPEEDENDPDTMFVKSAISRANSARQALLQQSMRNESFESEFNLSGSQESESSSSTNDRSGAGTTTANNINSNLYNPTKSRNFKPTTRSHDNTTTTTSSFDVPLQHQQPESRKGSLSGYKPKNTVIELSVNFDANDVEEV